MIESSRLVRVRKLYMLKINCRIDSKAIACDQKISSKYELLGNIASISSRVYGLSESKVLEGLLERESLGSTGFGSAIAIPHCKIDDIEAPVGIFISLKNAIDYDSVDEEAVDLVFALISPINNGAVHLRALAEVSRLLRDDKSRTQLRGAKNEDALFSMLSINSELSAA